MKVVTGMFPRRFGAQVSLVDREDPRRGAQSGGSDSLRRSPMGVARL
jgi:hypothetical protein